MWRALRDIPYGETESYGALAARIGDPKAVRAVGLANGANPISIIIPCHRVIGSNGSLTGYGGGLADQAGAARPRAGPAHAALTAGRYSQRNTLLDTTTPTTRVTASTATSDPWASQPSPRQTPLSSDTA